MSKQFRVTFIGDDRRRHFVSDRDGVGYTAEPREAFMFPTSQKAHAIARKLYKRGAHVQEVRALGGVERTNPGRISSKNALEVAKDMRHDVEIFYSKYRDRGNMYYYAFNHALATRDPRKMLTALKAMEDDMDIFYTKHREPGNRYYAAFKAVIGKSRTRSNPSSGKPKFAIGDRIRLVSRFKAEVQRGVVVAVDRGGKAAPGYVYQFEASSGNRAWAVESNLYHDRKYGR